MDNLNQVDLAFSCLVSDTSVVSLHGYFNALLYLALWTRQGISQKSHVQTERTVIYLQWTYTGDAVIFLQ